MSVQRLLGEAVRSGGKPSTGWIIMFDYGDPSDRRTVLCARPNCKVVGSWQFLRLDQLEEHHKAIVVFATEEAASGWRVKRNFPSVCRVVDLSTQPDARGLPTMQFELHEAVARAGVHRESKWVILRKPTQHGGDDRITCASHGTWCYMPLARLNEYLPLGEAVLVFASEEAAHAWTKVFMVANTASLRNIVELQSVPEAQTAPHTTPAAAGLTEAVARAGFTPPSDQWVVTRDSTRGQLLLCVLRGSHWMYVPVNELDGANYRNDVAGVLVFTSVEHATSRTGDVGAASRRVLPIADVPEAQSLQPINCTSIREAVARAGRSQLWTVRGTLEIDGVDETIVLTVAPHGPVTATIADAETGRDVFERPIGLGVFESETEAAAWATARAERWDEEYDVVLADSLETLRELPRVPVKSPELEEAVRRAGAGAEWAVIGVVELSGKPEPFVATANHSGTFISFVSDVKSGVDGRGKPYKVAVFDSEDAANAWIPRATQHRWNFEEEQWRAVPVDTLDELSGNARLRVSPKGELAEAVSRAGNRQQWAVLYRLPPSTEARRAGYPSVDSVLLVNADGNQHRLTGVSELDSTSLSFGIGTFASPKAAEDWAAENNGGSMRGEYVVVDAESISATCDLRLIPVARQA